MENHCFSYLMGEELKYNIPAKDKSLSEEELTNRLNRLESTIPVSNLTEKEMIKRKYLF